MKLLVLYTRLSGYSIACLRAYRDITGAELLVYAWPNQKNAPFDSVAFSEIGDMRSRAETAVPIIDDSIEKFQPDAVLVSGWVDKGYVKICRKLKKQGVPIVAASDTQWKGSFRQYIASVLAPWYVQKFIDVLWVSGERQRQFAARLGYSGSNCWDGCYACDWAAFSQQYADSDLLPHKPKFLYVGRYAPEKGLDILAKAYQLYCREVQEPWELICAGAGPLRDVLLEAGAVDRGFVQPNELPILMHEASAFILPSRYEPWGVVAQEAAASHLPLILSSACGSSVHLLRPYHNGFNFESGSVPELLHALKSMHMLKAVQRKEFGKASFEISKQYTPQRWAVTLMNGLSLLNDKVHKVDVC